MRRETAIAALILLGSSLGPAPAAGREPGAPPTLRSADLLADVDFLKRVYEEAHPGLYRYNTRPLMEGHFGALRAEFARDRTLAEAYVAFSQFLAKVRCGHSYANFSNQPEVVVRALFSGRNRIPFCFRWIGGRMIVTRDLTSDAGLAPGTEILAIDGIRIPEILAKLMTIARADGSNDAKRVSYLEVLGTGKYEAFDIFLPLFYPSIGDRMLIRARAPSAAEPRTVVVTAHDLEQRKALAKANEGPQRVEGDPLWRFEAIDDRTSYLRMPSWALYNSKWDWRGFLDRGMDELIDKGAAGLVLDLRGNEGGQSDIGNLLLSRAISEKVRYDRFRRYTRYRKLPFPKEFDAHLDTWDWSFKDWGQAARDDRDGFFRMTKFDDDEDGDFIAPRGRRFIGRMAVLIDASNSSATFQFAQTIKENRLATLVGRATGGNQRGINGGAFFFVTLPNSRIEFDLPLVGNFAGDDRPTGNAIPFLDIPDAGIGPDVVVEPSVEDVSLGRDPELLAARALLGRPR